MKFIGVDVEARHSKQINQKNYPSIIGIWDTADIAGAILGRPQIQNLFRERDTLGHQWSLAETLNELGIPNRRRHVAGNDAHFTLKALLMLAIHGIKDADITREQLTVKERIQAMSQTSSWGEMQALQQQLVEEARRAFDSLPI